MLTRRLFHAVPFVVFFLLILLVLHGNMPEKTVKNAVRKEGIVDGSVDSQITSFNQIAQSEFYEATELERFSDGWKDESITTRFLNYIRSRWLVAPSHRHHDVTTHNKEREKDFSQEGQSKLVDEILDHKTNGFFIECGAADGFSFSNSLFFERGRSWTGLLIEPNPELFKTLMKVERNANLINSCLSTTQSTERVSFKMAGLVSGIGNKMDSAHSKWVEGLKYQTITAQCFTLHSLLLAVGQTEVDYLSLDVEGPELEILQTIPFNKIKIKVISVEYRVYGSTTIRNLRMSLEKLDKLRSFFRSLGNYKEVGILPKNEDKQKEDEGGLDVNFMRI